MTHSIKLGSIFGIPLRLNYTWFIIFALVTFTLAAIQFPAEFPRWSQPAYWIAATATSLLFFASVVIHELSHSLVAQAFGVPVKSINLFIFGGVAQIAREASKPKNELLMALAGPASSVALAAIFWCVIRSAQTLKRSPCRHRQMAGHG
jgi:Zn-dependent protease